MTGSPSTPGKYFSSSAVTSFKRRIISASEILFFIVSNLPQLFALIKSAKEFLAKFLSAAVQLLFADEEMVLYAGRSQDVRIKGRGISGRLTPNQVQAEFACQLRQSINQSPANPRHI